MLEKELHDLLLLCARSVRAARASRNRRDVERGCALSAMSRVHTSAALEETQHGLGTPSTNRAMQWSRASFVLVFDVRSSVEEALNHRSLVGWVPRLPGLWPRIARIVESGGSTPILGVRVSSTFDERPDGEWPEGGRRKVQRRVSDV